jgi:uncharacterized membrane protein HdeD (DUF308 family)
MSFTPSLDGLQQRVVTALKRHTTYFLIEGIVLIILGFAAITVPLIATLAFTIFFGWLLLISGIAGLVSTFSMRQAPGFWWSLISGVLGIVVGALLLVQPLQGALSLTLVLIAFFVIEGVASIMFALDHKRELSGQWGWMMFSGLVDLVLAVLILSGLPGSAVWAIGLLVGINMIFGGWALVLLSLSARKAAGL